MNKKINLTKKSIDILEKIANSMHDHDPIAPNIKWFSRREIKVLEEELKTLLNQI